MRERNARDLIDLMSNHRVHSIFKTNLRSYSTALGKISMCIDDKIPDALIVSIFGKCNNKWINDNKLGIPWKSFSFANDVPTNFLLCRTLILMTHTIRTENSSNADNLFQHGIKINWIVDRHFSPVLQNLLCDLSEHCSVFTDFSLESMKYSSLKLIETETFFFSN